MDLRSILKQLVNGNLSLDDAEKLIKLLAIEELSNVLFDAGRELRRGIPEVVLAEGKDLGTLLSITRELVPKYGRVVISRVPREYMSSLISNLGDFDVSAYEDARLVVVRSKGYVGGELKCRVAVVTAGTADIPIAREVEAILNEYGCQVKSIYDVGVAGLQRVISAAKTIKEFDADVAVVIAGREGALPSVISSLLDIPIIGLPTSHGYGFGGSGISALMSMLQTCSLGIAVVNIDGGVAAALFTLLICRRLSKARSHG